MVWIMAAAQSREEKRVDRLIDTVCQVKRARPESRIGFFYVGSGLLLKQWQEQAQTTLPPGDWHFFGRQTDMAPYFQAASIFIHGSVRESFGLVLAEAMASGLPVIASRAHGPSELIEDCRTGYLIERDDWDGFVRAILRYIDQPDLRHIHGEAGRRRCAERFTADREASDLAALILPLLRRESHGWWQRRRPSHGGAAQRA